MHYARNAKYGSTDERPKRHRTKEELLACGFIKPKRPATCHPDRHNVTRGLCASCYAKEWGKKNPEKSGNGWLKRHPERAKFHARKNSLMKKYGMTMEAYEKMLANQDGKVRESSLLKSVQSLR
jgi:hypothetical protein